MDSSTKEKTVEQKIVEQYEAGQGTIQDYARIYGLPVARVLAILGQEEMNQVTFMGDAIDQAEAGPNVIVNKEGKTYEVPFTVD